MKSALCLKSACSGALLASCLLWPAPINAAPVPDSDLARIREAVPTAAQVPPSRPRKLLVFTLARGYIHESTPWGVEALKILGERTGAFAASPTEDPAVFEWESLRQFDAVCFLNTCYTPFTNALLKSNLLKFINEGRGYVGIHCAAHTFLDWPEFGRMQGAYSTNHPWTEQVTTVIEEPENPLMKCFGGPSFVVTDEIYQFASPYSRQNLRVLMRLDTKRTAMDKQDIYRTDGDFGLVWIRSYGRGRVFFSAFGHEKAIFWNPTILRSYLAGIQYACGDLPADATPKPMPK
jgi:type 1 glutamine amidotransferase